VRFCSVQLQILEWSEVVKGKILPASGPAQILSAGANSAWVAAPLPRGTARI
jgi:hypothetical protein